MTDERRYGDEEVREIFELASSTKEPGMPARTGGEGLTLAELKEIGKEVGLDPERVGQAATALEVRRATPPARKILGMPLTVGRVVDLPRAPTDSEWERLVAELRQTFGAKGKVSVHGSLREWRNGNLHASVEPTESGYRLRLGTLKGSAVAVTRGGTIAIVFSLVMLAVLAMTGQLEEDFALVLIFAMMGGAALASNVLTLPRWARERDEQMDYIAHRARAIIGPGTGDDV